MTKKRPPALFLADALGLDFLNSVVQPGRRTEVEWLASGEDLLAWLVQAHLVPTDAAEAIRASAFPGELDAVAAQAQALREWFRDFVLVHKGKPLTGTVLEELIPLNQVLERDEAFGAIGARSPHVHDGPAGQIEVGALELHIQRRWRSPASLLLPIARAMADFICSADFVQVKKCESPTCTLFFLDTTQGHARRWCSMATCGNRAKQAAHRTRNKPSKRQIFLEKRQRES